MGDMGLQSAYGLSALQQQIRQRIADQLMQRQQDFQNQITLRGADRADAQLQETSALRRAQEAETARQHDLTAANQQMTQDTSLAELTPPGDVPVDSPIAGRLRRVGVLDESKARPAVDVGPLLPGDTGAARAGVKLPTAKQQDTAADNARQADAIARQREADAGRQRHELAMEKAAANRPAATITVQTVDENGSPVTKVVPKTAGASYPKGPSAVTQNRLDSALAVKQTGEDMIAQLNDPAFRNVVGPAMGRAGTLRDFIGNPPPEFAQLAGQIESYALANMGVHGMRSAQGAQQIAKLLDQHHTPESLIAAIQGLNGFSEHFLANAGRTTPSGGGGGKGGMVDMVAPDGRSLSVPADKVAELERKGAKRR